MKSGVFPRTWISCNELTLVTDYQTPWWGETNSLGPFTTGNKIQCRSVNLSPSVQEHRLDQSNAVRYILAIRYQFSDQFHSTDWYMIQWNGSQCEQCAAEIQIDSNKCQTQWLIWNFGKTGLTVSSDIWQLWSVNCSRAHPELVAEIVSVIRKEHVIFFSFSPTWKGP